MKLIDIYVTEVGENLPGKMRADIEAEIRSLIEDTLEGRAQEAGREPDEAMVVDVLKEFGPPAQMAASYLPQRYLIGPRMFPIFILVMRIVLAVLVVLGLIQVGIAVSEPGLTFEAIARNLGEQMVDFFVSALSALGNVVFIFAILEWALPKGFEKKEVWDPRSMKPRSEPEKVNLAALFWEIAFALAAILVFNVYPQWIGMTYLDGGQWRTVPVLSEVFFRLVPLLSVTWALHIVLNIVLVRRGRWEPATRWFQVALKVFGLVILGMMIAGAPIIDLSQSRAVMPFVITDRLVELIYNGFRALLVLVMVLDGFELAKMLIRLLVRNERPLVVG